MGAAFKDLCIDTNSPPLAATFWSQVLGLGIEPNGETFTLVDQVPEHRIWLNLVPETKQVKNRIHLDVHTPSIEHLRDLGATVLDDSQPWTVLADPEGGEFCGFVRSPEKLPDYRLYELAVDCADPARIADWWAARFGVDSRIEADAAGSWLEGVPGTSWDVVFNPVEEPKVAKNRVHWDLWGSTAEFLDAGARLLRGRDNHIGWDVLADPEGNEFCVFTRR